MPGDKYTKAEKVGVDVPRAHNSQDDGDARSPGRIARSALPCASMGKNDIESLNRPRLPSSGGQPGRDESNWSSRGLKEW